MLYGVKKNRHNAVRQGKRRKRLTTVVDDFQVHPGRGFARIAERCRIRRQSTVSFAVTHGHHGLRRVTHQARWNTSVNRGKYQDPFDASARVYQALTTRVKAWSRLSARERFQPRLILTRLLPKKYGE